MNNVKSTQQERFKYMREEIINLSQQKLADTLNIKQQSIADIESGRKQKIDTEILFKLLNEFNINTEWLLFGTGYITKQDIQDDIDFETENVVKIPFFQIGASAGTGNDVSDNQEVTYLKFDERWIRNILGVNPSNLVLIYASGNSMDSGCNKFDDIKDKDMLLVDKSQLEGNGRIYVIKDNGQLKVKRLFKKPDGSLIISSNNPEFEDITYSVCEMTFGEVEVIGRVVWNGSKENV